MAEKPWKWQARYDALSWWHKFLFNQNPVRWIDAWRIEEAQWKYEVAIQALKVLAFVPDNNGFIYDDKLTDVRSMAYFAKLMLKDLGEL